MSQKQTQQERGRSPSPANQMQQVQRGHLPRTIDRVDQAYLVRGDPQGHIHFKDGRHALNPDGTWKHGGRLLSQKEQKWITENNWTLPKQDDEKK